MVTLAIVDRAPAGGRPDTWDLEIFEERLALRELIRRRVFQEVAEHNARRSGSFRGLVRPTDTERTLNGIRGPASSAPSTPRLAALRAARAVVPGQVFLPFEEDRLMLILSKAFLLADDARITDPLILAQLRSR
jgi:hypothetical protein